MPYCIFEKSSGLYVSGSLQDPLPFDSVTHVRLVLTDYPDRRLNRWDGAIGLRNATAQEMTDYDAALLQDEADTTIENSKFNRLLFEVNFDQENRLRVREGRPTITKNQYKTALVNTFKALP